MSEPDAHPSYGELAPWWPLISATDSDRYTLTVGIAASQMNFAQTNGLGFLMAQAVFASVPILLIYVIFQRYIVAGVGRAVDGVSFTIPRGKTLALVGESGCGKTSLSKLMMRAMKPDRGSITFNDGGSITDAGGIPLRFGAGRVPHRVGECFLNHPVGGEISHRRQR